jgi:cytoskeletal protein CcmA (bactofilin family)
VSSRPGAQGLLVLSEKGEIEGGVKVHDAVINGRILGDVEVDGFLELQANARVNGNITYRQLKMDCGASVEGRLEPAGERAAQSDDADSTVVSLPNSSHRTMAAAGGD